MTDQEMTTLCAHAMDIEEDYTYDPLHDDAQAMALVKKFDLDLTKDGERWHAAKLKIGRVGGVIAIAKNADLNRAIVECIAKMQQSQQAERPARSQGR